MTDPIVLWRWRIRNEVTGKMRLTKHHMTERDALARHPEAVREDATREERAGPADSAAIVVTKRFAPNPKGRAK